MPVLRRGRRVGEHGPQLALDEIPQRLAAPRPRAHGRDDALSGWQADVGGYEQLFERVDRFDIHRAGTAVGRIGAAGNLLEPPDDLLRRSRQPLANSAQKTHGFRFYHPGSGSARCGRTISSPNASRALRRPLSTWAICVVIGSSMPARSPSASAASVVRTPSATIFMPPMMAGSDRPRASSIPTWRFRLCVPVQVSTRSPSPASPASVSRRGAERRGQAADLGEPARDERSKRVVSETEPLDHAGGNGDDVLERAAHLDPDHIVSRVQPEVVRSKFCLHAFDGHTVVGGHADRRRQVARELDREAGPRKHHDWAGALQLAVEQL